MKTLSSPDPEPTAEAKPYRKHNHVYARVAVKPPPAGQVDPRGWIVAPSKEKKYMHSPWVAYAYIDGKPYWRRFRTEADARAFADELNAKEATAQREANKPHADEPLLKAKELRARMRLSRDQLKKLKEEGLPFVKISRQDHRYYYSEVLAFFTNPREEGTERIFSVEPYRSTQEAHFKFRVRGTGKWSAEKRKFRTEAEAQKYAAKRNHEVGIKPKAPRPRRVRGMDEDAPFYRVKPYNSKERTDLHYEVSCFFEGAERPKTWRFRTEAEALHFASVQNAEAMRQIIREEADKAPMPTDVAKAIASEPKYAPLPAWTEQQVIDSARASMTKEFFRVFPTSQGKYKFVVRGPRRPDGSRGERKFFATEREAQSFAHMRNTEAETQGLESLAFPSWLRVMAQRCQHALDAHGKTLEDATRHYIEYLARTNRSCPLRELSTKCQATKKAAGVSKPYLREMKVQFDRFTSALGPETFASEVTAPHIDAYLLSLTTFGPSSRNSVRRLLCTLFNYGKDSGVCSENPAEKSAVAKVVPPPVGIFTPEQIGKLLEAAPLALVPFLAIGAFAGLRVAEIVRLDWAQVDLLDGYVEVTAQNAKSARRRVVKILPALDAWIRPLAKTSGPVWPYKGFIPTSHIPDVMKVAGIDAWPRNALRHSFASYHLAHFKDAAALALEMGHTTTNLIFEHYRQVVRATVAENYWALRPSTAGEEKLIAFRQAAQA